MNKSEIREIQKIKAYVAAGLGLDFAARAISALIRSARTNRSKIELSRVAADLGCQHHPEYIC
jgi:ABC-type Zn uptake system ZnuABC Zn-binding protein ZnuA